MTFGPPYLRTFVSASCTMRYIAVLACAPSAAARGWPDTVLRIVHPMPDAALAWSISASTSA